MPTRPSDTYWHDGSSPALYPGLNDRENAVKDYVESFIRHNIFFPEDYGAVRDGATDDTDAINSCIAAAITAAQDDETFYCEVQFSSGVYLIAGSLVQGGDTKGNAQIPLPVIDPTTSQKLTMVLRGTRDATALPHWEQDSDHVQQSGVVLKTTATGSNNGTFGIASVVGGPTTQQGYGPGTNLWNNMLVVLDGITVLAPYNPTMSAFDFSCMAQANVPNAAALVENVPGGLGGGTMSANDITNQWTFGLRMPFTNNNDNCNVGNFSVEGYCDGFIASEHTVAQSVRAIYCINGIVCSGGGGTSMPHGGVVQYASCEQCLSPVCFKDGASKIDVLICDIEQVGFKHVNDPSNLANSCTVGMRDAGTALDSITVGGGANLRTINLDRPAGVPATQPTVPSSTTARRNPYDRDCGVVVSGGTVTAIAVDGTTLGVTSGTVLVPTNKTITLTYSAAPSWKWTVL